MQYLQEYERLGCGNRTLKVFIKSKRIYMHTGCFRGTALQFLRALWVKHTINQYAQVYVDTLKTYMSEHKDLFIKVSHRYLDDPSIWTDVNTAKKQWKRNVKLDGCALKHVPKEHRSYDMCLSTVQQNGLALAYVPKEHRSYDLCLSAVQQYGFALLFVPQEHRSYDLCLSAVQQDGCTLKFVPEEHQSKIKKELKIE